MVWLRKLKEPIKSGLQLIGLGTIAVKLDESEQTGDFIVLGVVGLLAILIFRR